MRQAETLPSPFPTPTDMILPPHPGMVTLCTNYIGTYGEIGMNASELDNYLREQMGALYFLEETPTTRGAQADCITDCYKQFTNEDGTKKPGRGSCKLGCWVDSVKDFVKEIIDGVAGIF